MTTRQPLVVSDPTHPARGLNRWFTRRQLSLLRQAASSALFVLLITFWCACVFTFLMAGWWIITGTSRESENAQAWGSGSDWLLLVLALASALPVQRWLRTQIAHFVEDNTDNPYAIISRLSEQIDASETGDSLMQTVVRSLGEALDVPYVSLETVHDGLTVVYGAPAGNPLIALPLEYDRSPLGRLQFEPRVVGGVPLRVDEQLLGDLARQVSLTLHAARLSVELQESRRRIVTAREEGRRQLRHDLHDGLGPALATLTMQADTARELVYDDPAGAERLLGQLVDQAQATVAEVRRIVHGLRPPALDELGLFGALEVLAGSFASPGFGVTLHLPVGRPTLSAALEVAIYRILQEALTNVTKHARARTASVSLQVVAGQLALTVCDDGVGMPAQPVYGLGIQSMRARAEELGGVLSVRPNGADGCCLFVHFPLEPGDAHGADSHPDL